MNLDPLESGPVIEFGDLEHGMENFQPLREGRDILMLQGVAHRTDFRDAEEEWRAKLARNAKNAPQQLEIWDGYINWATQIHQEPYLRKLLEEATNKLNDPSMEDVDEAKKDIRLLRIWVKRAGTQHKLEDQLLIMEHTYRNNIGTQFSLLYEGLANLLEKKQEYKKALEVYDKGLSMGAAPRDRLQKRRDQFLKRQDQRMARRRTRAEHPSARDVMGELEGYVVEVRDPDEENMGQAMRVSVDRAAVRRPEATTRPLISNSGPSYHIHRDVPASEPGSDSNASVPSWYLPTTEELKKENVNRQSVVEVPASSANLTFGSAAFPVYEERSRRRNPQPPTETVVHCISSETGESLEELRARKCGYIDVCIQRINEEQEKIRLEQEEERRKQEEEEEARVRKEQEVLRKAQEEEEERKRKEAEEIDEILFLEEEEGLNQRQFADENQIGGNDPVGLEDNDDLAITMGLQNTIVFGRTAAFGTTSRVNEEYTYSVTGMIVAEEVADMFNAPLDDGLTTRVIDASGDMFEETGPVLVAPIAISPQSFSVFAEEENEEPEDKENGVLSLRRSIDVARSQLDSNPNSILRVLTESDCSDSAVDSSSRASKSPQNLNFEIFEDENDNQSKEEEKEQPGEECPTVASQSLNFHPHTLSYFEKISQHAESYLCEHQLMDTCNMELKGLDVRRPDQIADIRLKLSSTLEVNVLRFLGEGGYARVFEVTTQLDNQDHEITAALEACASYAMKFSSNKTGLCWEYLILHTLKDKMEEKKLNTARIDQPSHLIQFSNASIMLSPFIANGSLNSLCEAFQKKKQKMDELLIAYFVYEMLEIVESLHSCGILHCDIKPDNILILSGTTERTGRGLRIIDFGRALDLSVYHPQCTFIGSSAVKEFATDREEWREDIDLVGVAGILVLLLTGEFMQTQESNSRTCVLNTIRRAREGDFDFALVIDALLNSGRVGEFSQSSEQCTQRLKQILKSFIDTKGPRALQLQLVKANALIKENKT